jgi:hypothetical protein
MKNIDIAPTVMDILAVEPEATVDGSPLRGMTPSWATTETTYYEDKAATTA